MTVRNKITFLGGRHSEDDAIEIMNDLFPENIREKAGVSRIKDGIYFTTNGPPSSKTINAFFAKYKDKDWMWLFSGSEPRTKAVGFYDCKMTKLHSTNLAGLRPGEALRKTLWRK